MAYVLVAFKLPLWCKSKRGYSIRRKGVDMDTKSWKEIKDSACRDTMLASCVYLFISGLYCMFVPLFGCLIGSSLNRLGD